MPRTVDGYDIPALTVDTIVLRGDDVLLVRRARAPFADHWALPGGFVEHNETVEHAARRETEEETGVAVELERLLGVYSRPGRDPRHHTVSVVFVARPLDADAAPRAGSDAAAARWCPRTDLPPLAFDHDRIVADVERGHKDVHEDG